MNIFKPITAVIVVASAFAGAAHADIIKPGPWPEIVKPEGYDSGGQKEPNRAGA